MHSGSTAGNTDSKLYAYEAGKRAVEAYLKRKGWQGEVTMTNDLGFYRTRYQVPSDITVGIRLWGEASAKFEKVLAQVKQELEQANIKIVWEGEWQSKSNCPDYIIILNRAVTGITKGGILRLLGSCAREDIGMVGSRTILGGKVLQCGYWKKNNELVPRFEGLPRHFKGYFRRAYLPVEVDAVSYDLTVIDGKQTVEKRIIAEPAIEVAVEGR